MTEAPGAAGAGKTESCWKFLQIFKSFRLASRFPNLAVALAAILATFAWGGLLDVFWKWADRGVPANAIGAYAVAGADQSFTVQGLMALAEQGSLTQGLGSNPKVDKSSGLFAVWYKHEGQWLEAAMASVWQAEFMHMFSCLALAAQGSMWLWTQHTFFAVLFFLGCIAIWAFAGGFICRIAAVQFAREESIGFSEAIAFVKRRYAGLLLAPLIPLIAILVVGLGLILGGLLLSIPYFGDVVGSILFGLALLVGVLIALLVLGSWFGGHLFWPTIAVEGSDGLDAVSRSVNYVAARPWRTIGYGLVAIIYVSLCYLLAKLFAFVLLKSVHLFVGFGTSPFGWWGERQGIGSKLDALWTMPSWDLLRPVPGGASGIEAFASWGISIWVLLVIALLWALVISLYFSASTIIYFLLRQDNDAMGLDDIYIEDYREGVWEPGKPAAEAAAAPAPAPSSPGGVQVTIGGKPADADASADASKQESRPGGSDED